MTKGFGYGGSKANKAVGKVTKGTGGSQTSKAMKGTTKGRMTSSRKAAPGKKPKSGH